jgi:hypothetical protein
VGSFSQRGDEIEWTFAYESSSSGEDEAYYNDCGSAITDDLYDDVNGSYSGQSELDCGGEEVDVWSFVASAGDTADIAIDTVGNTTAFDPLMWVNDPSGCTLNTSDDSFDCTYPPPSYQCPSTEQPIRSSGSYEIVVASFGSCAGSVGEYEIVVDLGGSNPRLTLEHDDVSRYSAGATTMFDISGFAVISE